MTNNPLFLRLATKHFQTLEKYVPVVSKVHGKTHPEFYEVHKYYDSLAKKIKSSDSNLSDLSSEFQKLREITNNYSVPNGVCESYEAVYSMLSELDKAYHALH